MVVDNSSAQRASSPRGEASTQIGADHDQWIVVDYSRPILRGRTGLYGLGNGNGILSGADVWRVGADRSTSFSTETDLMIGGHMLPAGEYTLFMEMGEEAWTIIFSDHKGKSNFRSEEEGIWGAYGYSMDKDVLRAPLMLEAIDVSMDQFTIAFFDVTADSGMMGLVWENTLAMIPFSAHSMDD